MAVFEVKKNVILQFMEKKKEIDIPCVTFLLVFLISYIH